MNLSSLSISSASELVEKHLSIPHQGTAPETTSPMKVGLTPSHVFEKYRQKYRKLFFRLRFFGDFNQDCLSKGETL